MRLIFDKTFICVIIFKTFSVLARFYKIGMYSVTMADAYQRFKENYLYIEPISVDVRKKVLSFIELKRLTDWEVPTIPLLWLFYDVLVVLLVMAISFVRDVKKRRKKVYIFYLVIIARLGIVILAAPTTFFMYSFSTYLVGGVMSVCFYLLRNAETKQIKQSKMDD